MLTVDKENNNNQKGFAKKHPILLHSLLIVCTACAVVYLSLILIDVFTEHGTYKEVPNVKDMPIRQAIDVLEEAGFKWEITDSIYNDKIKPGAVTEQNPKGKARVKSNRTIYLGINAMSPRTLSFPNIMEISVRQGEAILQGLGFKNIIIETIPSPFKGLILEAKINGLSITAGRKVPASSHITLVVGDGNELNNETDSIVGTDTTTIDDQGVDMGVDFMQ